MLEQHHTRLLLAYLSRLHWIQLQGLTEYAKEHSTSYKLGVHKEIQANINLHKAVASAISSINESDLLHIESELNDVCLAVKDYQAHVSNSVAKQQ